MTDRRVAVVTGGNRGIGFAIVRQLCQQFQGDVILTSRNIERGLAAVETLKKEGFTAVLHQLDVTDVSSAHALRDFLLKKYGGLDILVNNAGISAEDHMDASFPEQAEATLNTNYWGMRNLIEILNPILRDHARVVSLSSALVGTYLRLLNDQVYNRLMSLSTIADVDSVADEFVRLAKTDQLAAEGWAAFPYRLSKVLVNVVTEIYQRLSDAGGKDILYNSCCPGLVQTHMSFGRGVKNTEQGADTPVYLALLPRDASGPRGQFVIDRRVIDWRARDGGPTYQASPWILENSDFFTNVT